MEREEKAGGIEDLGEGENVENNEDKRSDEKTPFGGRKQSGKL